jgi:hypothetical protein
MERADELGKELLQLAAWHGHKPAILRLNSWQGQQAARHRTLRPWIPLKHSATRTGDVGDHAGARGNVGMRGVLRQSLDLRILLGGWQVECILLARPSQNGKAKWGRSKLLRPQQVSECVPCQLTRIH